MYIKKTDYIIFYYNIFQIKYGQMLIFCSDNFSGRRNYILKWVIFTSQFWPIDIIILELWVVSLESPSSVDFIWSLLITGSYNMVPKSYVLIKIF